MEISEPLMAIVSVLYISVFVIFANCINKDGDCKKCMNSNNDWMK